jgi:hypothetical protein
LVSRQSHRGQHANDGDHDHELDQGEAALQGVFHCLSFESWAGILGSTCVCVEDARVQKKASGETPLAFVFEILEGDYFN